MTRETERIADQLRRAWEGDAWHGPPLKKALDPLTARQAAAHPSRARTPSGNWRCTSPPGRNGASEAAWRRAMAGLEERNARIERPSWSPAARIQHHPYHAGQIVLLRKLAVREEV